MTFQDAISAGLASIRSAASQAVVYSRGNKSANTTAVRGKSMHELQDRHQTLASQTIDWLISAEDWAEVIAEIGGSSEPEERDMITLGSARYVVKRIQKQKCWRYSDSGQTQLRIHTMEH